VDLNGPRSTFQVDLSRLPASIDKLVFTAATEQGSMRALGNSSMALGQAATFAFTGNDFQDEKAVIMANCIAATAAGASAPWARASPAAWRRC